MLGWAGVSQAENTFFWRMEGTTLSGTDDHDAGDTSIELSGTAAINGTAALVGSNGVQILTAGDHARWDSSTALISPTVGSVGFRVRVQTWANGGTFWYVRGSSYTYAIRIAMVSGDELRLQFNEDSGVSTLDTTAANLATDTTYIVTASWDQPANARRLRVYNSSNVLIQEVSDLTTAYTAPVDLATTNGARVGDATGANAAYYIDNLFLDDTWAGADEILCNNSITSYTAYAACSGGARPGGLLLGVW